MGVYVSISGEDGENLGSWYASDSGEHTVDPPTDNPWGLNEATARVITYLDGRLDNARLYSTKLAEDADDCISAAYDFLNKISTED